MTDVVFAWGPGEYFFMESPSMWKMNLPPGLQSSFDAPTEIAHVHTLVLGANDSWYMSYKKKNGRNYQTHQGLPAELAAWLDVKDSKGFITRKVSQMRLSLGPGNESYYVSDGSSFQWYNLPTSLNKWIEDRRKPGGGFTSTPRIVSLGIDGDYIASATDGSGSYLLNHYPALLEHIKLHRAYSDGFTGPGGMYKFIHYISLDQHDGTNFFFSTTFNFCTGWTPDVPKGTPDVMGDALLAIIESLPKITKTSNAVSSARGSTGSRTNSNSLVNSFVRGMNLNNSGQQYSSGGGGDYSGGDGGGGVDYSNTMNFAAGLQQNTWDSTSGAASDGIQ